MDEALEFALKAADLAEYAEARPLSLLAEIYVEREEFDNAIKTYDNVRCG